MANRDEFRAETKRTLAARAGYHCSNPECARSTSGAALAADAAVSIGVAAHIAGAASGLGSVRYDPSMSSEERRGIDNGIWLCGFCSILIDKDKERYSRPFLKEWKADAERRAAEALASGRPLGPVRSSLDPDDADEEFLSGLGLPSADAVDTVGVRLREASRSDIEAFRREPGRPGRTVPLTLRLRGSDVPGLTLESLSRLTVLAEPVYIVAPGGTGKSTTLIQLAERSLAGDGPVPLFVPLGEWSDREDDFFDLCLRRNAFGGFKRQHLMQLAHFGRLLLLLDGWNEIAPEARLRATRDVAALRREYPQLGIVISTRARALPATGRVVEIEMLSHDQQVELATAVRGESGVALLDQAWRTRGVRDLVSIPLYLNALLALPHGASFPETKEAILRMFVEQNVSAPDRAERLKQEFLGHHNTFLESLAIQANQQANGVFTDSNAKRVISSAVHLLIDGGQIGPAALQPADIIGGLAEAHLLVRSEDNSIRFQHQLFQQWYAATEVEQLMLRTAEGDSEAKKRLREEILNWFGWEESILFACDRLSRADSAGVSAVATAIGIALGIDPVLAAMMVERAADTVWVRVCDRILQFVARWHTPGTFDRAVRFMVASGKPDFADLIWPLVSSTDHNIQFNTFEAADTFRPSVLGPDREARLRALPGPERKVALSEIASNSGFDGMELATNLAAADPDPDVVVAVVEALAFRAGNQHVNRIMQVAPDAVWKAFGSKSYPYRFTDPVLNARLVEERAAALTAETRPATLLLRLADEEPADAETRIAALFRRSDIEFSDQYLEHAIAYAYRKFPSGIASGLIARIASDLTLPHSAAAYLKDAPVVDDGVLAEVALNPATPTRSLNAVAGLAGPATVSALFEQLFAIDNELRAGRQNDRQRLSDAHGRLVGAISSTRQEVFVQVLSARANTDDPPHIGLMADLLARHGREGGDFDPPIDGPHRATLRTVIKRWISTLLRAPNPVRHSSAEVARATGRLADASLAEDLRRLLERDLTDQAADAARHAAPQRPPGLAIVGYSRMYAHAFAKMRDAPAVAVLTRDLSDLRWGLDAAGALYEIWSVDHLPQVSRTFGSWTDASQHQSRRAERAASVPLTSDFAEAIFAVVRTLGDATKSDLEQRHAIGLAATGLGLPHGNKRKELDALLSLPQPSEIKQRLLVCAAQAGEVIPAPVLMDGLRNLLEAARTQTWRLNQNRGELMVWIDLFPFSDDPARIHEAIALLPEQHRQPYALHRLLETLPQSPAVSALATLERLATDDPSFLQDFAWMDALLKLDSEAAALAALDRLRGGAIPIHHGFQLSRALTGWARKYATVRSAMIARYRTLPPGDARRVFEMAMGDLTDEEVFWALFDGHGDAPTLIGGLGRTIRNLAIGHRPSDEWAGAFEEFGLPLTGLRARLFAMLQAQDERARLAKTCLIAIEEHRDDRGRVDAEPRHPDIATGRPWPPEAEEP